MGIRFCQFITSSKSSGNNSKNNNQTDLCGTKVNQGRGKSYCLIHRRYFETSWCPDCSRSSRK